MYSPQPISKRPPGFLEQASFTSLLGSERSVPSFQSFVSGTPRATGSYKPLPPDPPHPQHSSEQLQEYYFQRRSSSVYSRTANHWATTPELMAAKESVSTDRFPLSDHVAGSYAEKDDQITAEILRPLVYTPSQSATPPKMSYDSGVSLQVPKGKSLPFTASLASISTVEHNPERISLDEARGQIWYRGKPALLPEEMRAQAALQRSVVKSGELTHHVHHYGHQSGQESAPASYLQPQTSNRERAASHDYHDYLYGNSTHTYQMSRGTDSDASLLSYEPRGRTTARCESDDLSSRVIQYGPPIQGIPVRHPGSPSEAERLAQMYHSVLRDESLHSSRRDSTDSIEDDTRTAMKMVPQPLFFNPRQVSEQRMAAYNETRHQPHVTNNSGRPGILKNPLPYAAKPSLQSVHTMYRADSGTTDLSLPSAASAEVNGEITPILGRFASHSIQARDESPHLHSPKERTPGNGTLAAMKDIFSTGNGTPFRRMSVHLPSVITSGLRSQSTTEPSSKHKKKTVAELKSKLVDMADAAKPGFIDDIAVKRNQRAAEKRKREIKRTIRVIPNK